MFCFIFLNIFLAMQYAYILMSISHCQLRYRQPNKTGLVTILLKLGVVIDRSIIDVWNILTPSIKLNYAMPSVVILNGPVAQPGRVPDFYPMKEIRLSRVRIPTGPH